MDKRWLLCSWSLALLVLPLVAQEDVWTYPAPDGDRDQKDLSFYEAPAELGVLPHADFSARPRNVILMIGDGMGFNVVSLARLASVGADGRLHMERMPVTGIMRTHSASALMTDSAAAGTALAMGIRTTNRQIGMDRNGKRHKSILQAARDHGYRTALVVNATITHATPAPFAAHVKSRDMHVPIAAQMLTSRVDILLAGGRQYFLPGPHGERQDNRNLLDEARAAGYSVVFNREQLLALERLPVLGLFANDAMTTFAPEPMLAEKTSVALKLLSRSVDNKDVPGFFIMVEGSQIDWAGHENATDRSLRQTLLFDMAVKEALAFAGKDGNTLVIVTADHETGGLMIQGSFDKPAASWHTDGHTAADVPIYAYGPGSLRFCGTRDITEIPGIMADLLGFGAFPAAAAGENALRVANPHSP